MTGFEYKVVPAPRQGLKAKGIKTTPARFANALQTVMNDLGADGWEYQRTDTLPVEERQGLTGKTTTFQNMLVFRRALEIVSAEEPEVAALIEDQSDVLETVPEVEDIVEVEDIAVVEDTAPPTAEDFVGDAEQEEAAVQAKAAMSLQGADRVDETLKAPFVFPWNKRTKAAAASKDDSPHIPAQ